MVLVSIITAPCGKFRPDTKRLYPTVGYFASPRRKVTLSYRATKSLVAHQPPIKAWPGLTTKAATTPLAMSDLGIAGIADISPIIAPASAFSALVARGITVSLAGITSKFVPARIVDVNDAGSFCAEGAPIPVHQSTILAGPEIKPYKLACIIVLTRELSEHSVSDAETIVQSMMSEAAALKLDSVCLGNGAAVTGVQPAGILNGVSAAGTSTANKSGAHLALARDIEILMTALAAAGAGVSPVFVCAPAQAASMKTLVGPKFDYPIIASVGVAAGTVIAIEGPSFVSGFSGVPEFSIDTQTVLHMADPASALSTVGTPNVVAAPERSLFQTDCIAVKMILRCGWGMRASGHVQYLTGVNW
jgi:hypothetical protein